MQLTVGTSGADNLVGGAGNDILLGGLGDDTLWGGTGTNTFAYANNWGQDIIKDWTAGTNNIIDMTALSSLGVHGLANLSQSAAGGSDVISYGANAITLEGFNQTLTASSFKFA